MFYYIFSIKVLKKSEEKHYLNVTATVLFNLIDIIIIFYNNKLNKIFINEEFITPLTPKQF